MKRFSILVLLVLSACGQDFPAPEQLQQGRFTSPSGDVFQFGVDGVTTQYRIYFADQTFEFEGSPVTEFYEFGIATIDRGRLVLSRTGVGFRPQGGGNFDGRTLPGKELQYCDITQGDGTISLRNCEDSEPWPYGGSGNWMAVGDLELTRFQ